ncbi:MAG TPA: methyltransferase domain-containing protein [Actinomycetota bacterium]|nr:methyltransferase domain-containing protein [Actinomycetota bacterium]
MLAPVTLLLGPAMTYNLLLILGLGLSAWTAYLAIGRFVSSRLAALPNRATVLEIGCGTGRVMQHVAAICERLHGIDISQGMVEHGRKRLAHLTNVSFEVGNGYDLAPFEDSSIDLVYSLYAFQHMPKTTAYNYFVESARVLRPEGLLRFQVPNILRDDHFLAFHHFTQPWFVEHPYPMNYYTPSEVVSLLGRAGFKVVDLDDRMTVVARKTADVTPEAEIRERVASFEHPSLVRALSERLSERTRQLEEATAELQAMRRRKAVRVANALRHPLRSLRSR